MKLWPWSGSITVPGWCRCFWFPLHRCWLPCCCRTCATIGNPAGATWSPARLNLFLKLLAFALTAASAAVLFVAPWLFGVAFQGKFAGGMAVLPWTLAYCIWFGVAMVAQQYLWCAERAGLVGLALGAGLAVNIALNLLLLPRLGLLGAVLAASAANLVALILILVFARLGRFPCPPRIMDYPVCSPGGMSGTLGNRRRAFGHRPGSDSLENILSSDEKQQLLEGIKHYWSIFSKWRGKWAAQN